MARKPVLFQADVDQLARLDRFAAEWCGGNRSRALGQAIEQMLAADAHHRQQLARREPPRGGWLPGPSHTANTVADADRPAAHRRPDGPRMTAGDRLRAARESCALTRVELALASGISVRMVRAVEAGEKCPSQRTAEAFERALLRAALARIANVEQAVAACARLDAAIDQAVGNGRVRAS